MFHALFEDCPIEDYVLVRDMDGYSATPSKDLASKLLLAYSITYKSLLSKGYEDPYVMAAEVVTKDLAQHAELNEMAFALSDRDVQETDIIRRIRSLEDELREVRSESARSA